VTDLPEALVGYLAKRDAERADKVQTFLDSLTHRERALIHDAAVMGYVQGLMRDRSEGCPKDSQVVHLVIDACFALPDKWPAVNGQLAPHPPTSTFTVETPRREEWGRWSPVMDDPEWAADSWNSALANATGRKFRMLRADTTYTVVAEHDPDEEA